MSLGGFRHSSIHITLSSRVKNAFQRHQLPQTTIDLTSASSSSAFTSLPGSVLRELSEFARYPAARLAAPAFAISTE